MELAKFNRVYGKIIDLHLQGKTLDEIQIDLCHKEGVLASTAVIQKYLGKRFGYCAKHDRIMTWEHKCLKC